MTKLYSLQFIRQQVVKAITVFAIGFSLINGGNVLAQCSSGSTQSFSSFSCNSANTLNNVNQGDYYRFTVVNGVSYNFTSTLIINPRMYAKVNNSSGTLVFDQDASTGNSETINWNATYSGTIAVATKYYVCSYWLAGYSATLSYKQNTTVTNTTNTSAICVGDTKSLTAVLGGAHNNPAVSWSIVSGSGSISGSTFTASGAGTVTVRATVGVCTDDVSFTVRSNSSDPSSLTSNLNNVCPGTTVRLTLNGGSVGTGGQYYFYTGGSCGGTVLYSGSNNYVDVVVNSTSTYSARISGTCNTTVCKSVSVSTISASTGPSSISKSTDNVCPNTSVTLTALGGSLGSGAQYYWYNGGSCSGTAFAVTSGNTTSVSPSSTSTYSVKIIGTCNPSGVGCASTTVNVTQTNSSGPSSLTSSANPICSGTNITLTAVSGTPGTGASYQWYSNVGCSGSPFTTTGTNTLSQSPSSTTQYSVRLSGSCNTTPCQATTVTVTPNVGVPSTPSGATSRCAGAGTNTYTSSASNSTGISWSILPGTAGSINSSGVVTWNSGFVGTATVTATASGCGSNQTASTSVEVYQVPVADAGSGSNECDLVASLQAFPSVGSRAWTQQSGPGTTTFSNPSGASTTATVTAYGTYVFRWTETNGVCSDFDDVTVNFYEQPDADAGGDMTVCGFTYGLGASASVGTGTWTKVFGPGTASFSAPNSANSNVTVSQAGSYVFRWTEVNGTCTDFDDVDITFVQQPVANAGSGGNECDLTFSFNASASVGTGTWTKTSGPGNASFNNSNSTTATVTVDAYGTYVFRWTEVNGSCSSFQEITVNFYLQPISVPGSGGSECDLSFQFNATNPNAGSGTWSKVSGPGTAIFASPTSNNTTVDVSAYGTYVFKWKVVNGTCSDSANVTVNFYEQPVADAGTNGLECDLTHQFNANPSVGVGSWSQAGGAGITTGYSPSASNPTATATVSTYGNYFYTWTEVNGVCSSSDNVQVLYNEIPTATISVAGEDTICLGDSSLISIALTGSSPWSVTYTDGITPVTINNISSSPYTFYTQTPFTYTVTNVTDFYNCVGTSSGAAMVFVNALPVQPVITNLSGLNGFCQGLFTNLSSSSDAGYVSYLWSPGGGTSQVIAANVAGDYVVTVTDTNDCQISSNPMNIVVYPNPVPTITASGSTTICQGQSVTLTSSAASSYLWSPGGETTQSINVTQSGNYTVHVVDANGCEGTSAIKQVTVNPLPNAAITPFGGSSNGATTFCQGQNVLLLSSSGTSYSWSPGGQTTQIISVTATGSHSVTVTDGNGCSATSSPVSVTVNSNPTPSIIAGGTTSFCTGGSVTLNSSPGNTYLWSPGGATTQSIVATTSGSYSVTVGDGNGCSGTSVPVVVDVYTNPTPTISASGPTTFCAGGNVTLTASSGALYQWSSGDTTQSINVTSSGTFTVTVTDANGCSGTSASTTVTVNPNPTPTISAGGPTTFCNGGSVTLTSSASSGNVWSTGLVGQSITVTQSGSYDVTVTNSNGCVGTSAPVSVTVNANPVVSITPSGPTNFCNGDSVILTASSGASYLWSAGAQTTQSVTASTSGTYTVTVTDANGCTGVSSQVVTVFNNPTPTISTIGSTTFCQGGSVQLVSSASVSYLWSPGGDTDQIIVAHASGSYSVTVTDANGCSGTSTPKVVTVNPLPTPTITPSGPTTFCQGGIVNLSSSSATSYAWSTGATSQSINVTSSGTYTVTVTDANGCTAASSATTVTVNPLPTPTITPSGPTTFCNGGSVTLTSSAGSSYSWSSGDTAQAIIVSTSGTFTVTVTDANGCTGVSSSTSVVVNANPVATITPSGATTFCQGGSVTLTSSSGTSYAWSTGVVSQSINVTQSGTYTVTVTNAAGCTTASSPTTVTVNPLPTPVISSGGLNGLCSGDTVVLETNYSGSGHVWSPGGQTSDTIKVAASGTYGVTYTDANGCTASATPLSVTIGSLPQPVVTALGPTTFCAGGSVQLFSNSSTGNLWSNGATTQFITVNTGGQYWVQVTDGGGCVGNSDTLTITVNTNPTPSITPSGPTTFCATGGSVTLTASSASSYLWSSGATTSSINVTSSGTFTVTVTDANSCTGVSSSTSVTVNANPTPTITPGGPTTFCNGGSVTLTSSAGASYAWSSGDTTQAINVTSSGTFTVTVTDANGCTGVSSSTTVTVNPNPVATITPSGATTFCAGGSVTLTSSVGNSYAWSTGVISQSINVTQSGTYTVTVTSAAGCSTVSSPTTVTVNPLPTPVISSSGLNGLCNGDTVVLETNYTGGGHVWSPGGQTSDTIKVSTSGTYGVTYTDANGCSATATPLTVNIGSLPQPVVTALGPTTFCAGGSVTLASNSSTGNLWSNGATTQFITVSIADDYTVTVTDGGGCVGTSAPTTVTVNANPTPSITPDGATTFCIGNSVNLQSTAGASYLWSTGSTAQTINVVSSGTFTVTMTDANGCTGVSPSATVTVNPLPTPVITPSGATTFCAGGSVTLSSSAATSYAWSNGVTSQSFSTDTSGTYNVLVTDANGCQATSANVTVTVNPNPAPVITASGPTTFCVGGSVTLTSSAASGNVWSNGLVSQSITVNQAGNYYVTVTNGNGCTTTSDTTVVTLNTNPTPTITASGPLTFCAGNSVTLTSSPSGQYSWSSGDTTQSIVVTTSGSFSVTVNDGNGCGGTSATTVVVVNANPTPTATPLGPTTFCQGQSVQLLSSASTSYLWSPGAVTSQILTATATGSYSVTVTDGNGCSGTSAPVAVTVTPLPTVSFSGLNARYCLDAAPATLVGTPSGGSFSGANIGNSFNPGLVGVGTYNVTYTYNNGSCSGSSTQQVIVDTIPVVSFTGLAADYCVDAPSVTLTGSPAGGTFSGAGISGSSFDPATATAGTHNITYYFIDGFGCDDSETQSVVVNPLPIVSISGIDNPYCEDAGLDSLVGVPSGGTFSGTGMFGDFFDAISAGVGSHTITYDYTDVNGCFNTVDSVLTVVPLPTVSFTGLLAEYCIDGNADTLTGIPAGGTFTGAGISGNVFTPGNAGLGTHVITYTYTDANGCTNSTTLSTDVVGLPSVSFAGLNLEYCVDGDTSVLTGFPGGGIFSGPGIFGNEFRPASAGEGTHTITYTYTDGSGCTNFITQNVTVHPLPVISFSGLAARYCINGNPSLLIGSPAGGTFTGSGLLGGNTFDPAFAGLGTHDITFDYTDANGCTNSLTQQTEVVPLPVVSFTGLNASYCVNAPNSILVGSPVGGSYTGPGIVSNTNTFSPFLAGVGTHTIVYTYVDANGCQNTASQTVTINALPNVSFFDLDPEYCLNGPFEALVGVPAGGTFTGSGMNGNNFEPQNALVGTNAITYTYTDTNGCTNSYSQNVTVHPLPQLSFTGLGSQYCVDADTVALLATPFGGSFSGSGVVGDEFFPSQAGVGVHSITYTYTDGNGCTGTDVQLVTVVDIPNVSFTGLDASYCVDEDAVNLIGTPSGGSFSGGNVIGNVFDPGRAGAGTHVISYTYSNVNGCDDVYYDTVVVHDLPVVTVSGLGGPYCIDDNNGVTLTGTPAGGIFTGDGMSGNVFTPNSAGIGTHFITYSYTDTNGCSNSIVTSAIVNALPSVSFTGLLPSYCVSQTTPVIMAGTPSGGQFSGPGVSGSTFNPSQAGVGLHSIVYTYTDVTGCTSVSTQSVIVHDLPVVSFSGLAAQYCIENPAVTLTGSPTGGTFSGPGISGTSFNPATAGVGFHTITYTYTNANGCTNTSTQTVTVLQLAPPVITTNGPTTFCQGSTLTLDAGANYSSYAWSDGNTITQTLVADHSATYAVTVTDTNGCSATSNVITVTATPLPSVSLGPDFSICPGELVTLSPTGTHSSYNWSTGETTPTIDISTDNMYWVDVTNTNGCHNRDTVVVTLHTPIAAVIQANGSPTICAGNQLTLDAGAGFTSYAWSNNVSTTQTITVAASGAYTVATVDSNGCSATSAPFIVNVQPLPGVPLYTNGPLSICQGETLQISTNPGFASYNWSTTAQTPSITVSTSGPYSVTVTDANGCVNSSITLDVIVHPNPNPVIEIVDGVTEFCKGQDTLVLTTTVGYVSYDWTTGDTASTTHITNSGTVRVSVIDQNGCGFGINSAPINVIVHNPQVPVISIFPGDTLRSSAAVSYQWFYDGNLIPGATSQIYVANQSGVYMVETVDANGCVASAVIEYSATGVKDLVSNNSQISLYPNPGNGKFTISAQFATYGQTEVTINNLLGQNVMPTVKIGEINEMNREFDLSGMPKGVYIVTVKFGNDRFISRYIKD